MTPLLETKNLTKTYPVRGGAFQTRRGEVHALDRVSLSLSAGESLGLVGESGSGKTTLARVVAGLLDSSSGQVLWEGRSQKEFNRRQWAGHVQMVFQDPSASLNPKLSVGSLLREVLHPREKRTGERVPVESALADVGLPADAQSYYPHEFSGGQKQRIAIARALAVGPRLLIADEPVSALDLSVQAQILNLLADLKDRFHLSLILISHDLTVVRHMTDRVLILAGGREVESGLTGPVLAQPAHSVTRALLEAVPVMLR
ncbi:MAG: ABC transporter ATP-binding protein [Elusimicrobia bacterium]|jgi:oligopeptide transport system ATP-binding protein|nr:ABC transporter ATP-binding protein [Elusimicrobiota bacterium]